MVYKSGQILPLFCQDHVCDGQTDGWTDGQTEFSSLYRVCITCSAVKITKPCHLGLKHRGDDDALR